MSVVRVNGTEASGSGCAARAVREGGVPAGSGGTKPRGPGPQRQSGQEGSQDPSGPSAGQPSSQALPARSASSPRA